jgi:cyclophilin family peptidyl-prolyl cis-trans isomerase
MAGCRPAFSSFPRRPLRRWAVSCIVWEQSSGSPIGAEDIPSNDPQGSENSTSAGTVERSVHGQFAHRTGAPHPDSGTEETFAEELPMRRFARSLWASLRDRAFSPSRPRQPRRPAPRRLELEILEGRTLPAAPTGTLTALAYIDTGNVGHFVAGDPVLPVLPVTLTGKTTTGTKVSETFTSNMDGTVTFFELSPGTYTVTFSPGPGYAGSGVISGIQVTAGKNTDVSVGFIGLSPDVLSERLFFNTSTAADFRFMGPAVVGTIPSQTVTTGQTSTTPIDLSGFFTAPDITNSLIRMDTSGNGTNGSAFVVLFDSLTPMTVTNYYNYINSGRFNDSIFHRKTPSGTDTGFSVLQGGGFTFTQKTTSGTTTTTLPAIKTDPNLQGASETGLANSINTIAMANSSGPNTANSGFYFNISDNSKTLSSSKTSGFTVFGKLLGSNDTSVINNLYSLPIPASPPASPFNEIPLSSTADTTNFPANLKKSDVALIKDVAVVSRPEVLTYSIVSNSAPSVVAVTLVNERLFLTGVSIGTATITVRATDVFGNSATASFTVNVI